MALRNIVLDGDPVLLKKSRPVEKFDARLAELLDDMGETMLSHDGMGLAGPQVGKLRRVFVALDETGTAARRGANGQPGEAGANDAEGETEDGEEGEPFEPVVLEFINPQIIEQQGERLAYEGCLSFPGRFGAIVRPTKVKVRAFDRYGKPFEREAEGVLARCICHETNHLDGITIDALAEYYYDPENPRPLDDTLEADEDGGENGAGLE